MAISHSLTGEPVSVHRHRAADQPTGDGAGRLYARVGAGHYRKETGGGFRMHSNWGLEVQPPRPLDPPVLQ